MEQARQDFRTLEEEISYQEEQAEQQQSRHWTDAVDEVRSAVRQTGLSARDIIFKKDTEADKGGGQQAIASYERSSNRISSVGAANFIRSAEQAGLSVREYTQTVLTHETFHRQSAQAKSAARVDNLITDSFGQSAVEAIEEATASEESGSDRFDSYDKERAQAGAIALKLGISKKELHRIRLEGDAHKLQQLTVGQQAV